MTWIDAIVSNLLAVVKFITPFRIIRQYERGVVFRLGLLHRTMEPGLHWHWPFRIEEVEELSVSEQTKNLLSQSVTTSDGVAVTFSVNIVYDIVDAAKTFTEVQDFEESLEGAAMIHLARRIRSWTWDELLSNQKDLEDSLEGTLTTRVKKWGARIITVGITDLTRAKPFRIFGDSAARSLIP